MTVELDTLDVEALPFDQYQRYRLVADLLAELRGDAPLRVLDVGGRTALLRAFLPGDQVELVDVEASAAQGLVLGTGAALPFQDGAFDAVCAFDTLEHVPPAGRAAFVAECARVSQSWVLLAGPYSHPRVDEAEERLVDFLEHKLRTEHRYLREHRDNGLPDRAATVGALEDAGVRVACFGHGELGRWLALMCIELFLDHDPMLRPIAPRFFRFYNRVLFESDRGEEVYRHVVVGAKGDARLPVGSRLDGPATPPAGSSEVLLELAAELMAFDRDRDALAPELGRLHGIIVDLEQDLSGHRATLADHATDLHEHRSTVAALRETQALAQAQAEQQKQVLERDLAEHSRALEDARRELQATLQDTRTRISEHEDVAATLQADLDGHRATVAELRGELERTQAVAREQARGLTEERDLARGDAARLEAELSRAREAQASVERGLSDAREEAQALSARLAQRERTLASLRADLRSRWGNLKRAFGRKPTFDE